jgi:hypothetical protein
MGVNVGQELKSLWGRVTHDPDVLFEVRQLFFGLVIVVVVCYGAQALLIQPRQKNMQKKVAQQKELKATLANGEIAAMLEKQFQQLMTDKKKLEESLASLRFQKQLYQEQFQEEDSKEQFSNVIFTLLPDSPVDIEGKFLQMTVMDVRSFDGFEVSPVNLQGDATYLEFLSYLRYLENRPEVGLISDLVMEQLVPEAEQPGGPSESVKYVDAFSQPVQVHFSLVLGRVQLR